MDYTDCLCLTWLFMHYMVMVYRAQCTNIPVCVLESGKDASWSIPLRVKGHGLVYFSKKFTVPGNLCDPTLQSMVWCASIKHLCKTEYRSLSSSTSYYPSYKQTKSRDCLSHTFCFYCYCETLMKTRSEFLEIYQHWFIPAADCGGKLNPQVL